MNNQDKSVILNFFINRLEKWEKNSPFIVRVAFYIIGILIIFASVLSILFSCEWKAVLYLAIVTIMFVLAVIGINYLKQRDVHKAQAYKGMQKQLEQLDEVKTLLHKFIVPELKRRERISIVTEILHKVKNLIKNPEQQKEFERKLKILEDLIAEREQRIIPNLREWQQAGEWLKNNQKQLVHEAIESYLKNNNLSAINQTPKFEESVYAHLQLIRTELESGGANLQELNFSQVNPRIPSERDAYQEMFVFIRKEIKKGNTELSALGQLVIGYYLDILVEEYD